MGRHSAPQRPGRMIPVLGTSCGLLAVAAFTGGVRPAVELPQAGHSALAAAESSVAEHSAAVGTHDAPLVGGPLDMPSIGVVAPGFDQRYAALSGAALSAAAHSTRAPAPRTSSRSNPAEELRVPSADESTDPPTSDPPTAEQRLTDPSPTTPPAPPTTAPPSSAPPSTAPPSTAPPSSAPPSSAPPSSAPPSTAPPSSAPPSSAPPSTAPPSSAPPSTAPPPTAPPPTDEPPADVELAIGEKYDVPDATGAIVFSIVVDDVVPDVSCTGHDSRPAKNGHLVGLDLRVTTGRAAADGDRPVFSAAQFQFLGAGAPVTTVDTRSAAACLDEDEAFPSAPLRPGRDVAGMVVLDVPESTGTIAYRPASGITSLLWRF